MQRIRKLTERGQEFAFGRFSQLRGFRNRLESLHFLLGVGNQLLHGARIFGGAARVARAALRSGDIGADGGPQHLRIGILDQVGLLDAQGIQGVDCLGAGPHAVPPQHDRGKRGQGHRQLGEHEARANLQIAKHSMYSGSRPGGVSAARP
ncbi:hypothetical protein FQZ97_864160 [compost metagenome]